MIGVCGKPLVYRPGTHSTYNYFVQAGSVNYQHLAMDRESRPKRPLLLQTRYWRCAEQYAQATPALWACEQ